MVIIMNNKLSNLREDNDYSQKDIATMQGIATPTYSKWEINEKIPPLPHINTLANIYDSSIDYLLGLKNINKPADIKKLDFKTNQYLTAYTNPQNFEETEFKEFIKLDNVKNENFIDSAYKYGLFNLKEKYQPTFTVLDGGGWELVITFVDGSTKVSRGSNAGPTRIFKKVDKAFFDIFGEEFFGYVDSEYMYPPYADIAIRSGNGSYGFGLTKKNYNDLTEAGVNCFTSGNHIWDKKDIYEYIEESYDHNEVSWRFAFNYFMDVYLRKCG